MLLLGGRLVKTYDWRTEWSILAPVPAVYEAMTSRSAVRQWWSSMELVDDGGGDVLRAGSSVDFRVHQAPEVARLAPPFRIHCVYTDVEPERRHEGRRGRPAPGRSAPEKWTNLPRRS